MPRVAHRLAFCCAALNIVVGLVAIADPRGDDTSDVVAMVGESPDLSPPGSFDVIDPSDATVPDGGSPETTGPSGGGGGSEAGDEGQFTTSTTVGASEVTTTTGPVEPLGSWLPEGEVGPGPHDLLGRVAYTTEESPTHTQLWSMRPDGTNRRRELDCPPPEVPPPSPVPEHYWLWETAYPSLSPDGRFIIRSCLARASTLAEYQQDEQVYGIYDLVIQDVDGSGMRVLWRYDVRDGHPRGSWSQDGRQLAVWTPRTIELIRTDGGGHRTLATTRTLLAHQWKYVPPGPDRLVWSPDGMHLVTSGYLEVVDLVTGAVDRPTDRATSWPWRAFGMSLGGVVAWDDAGIWTQLDFIPADMTEFEESDTYGVYHLDVRTGTLTQASSYPDTYRSLLPVGRELVGVASRTGAYTWIDTAGVTHAVPDLQVGDLTVAEGH